MPTPATYNVVAHACNIMCAAGRGVKHNIPAKDKGGIPPKLILHSRFGCQ